MITGEMKPEKQSELSMTSVCENQGIEEEETHLLHAADSGEASVAGTLWKPQQPLKMSLTDGHLERGGSLDKEKQSVTLQDEGPAWVTDRDLKTHHKPPIGNVSLKTVRATMFENNVERHHIAAVRLEAESALQPANELVVGHLGHCNESWIEKARETKIVSKKVPFRQVDISEDAEKHRSATFVKENKVPQTLEVYSTKEKHEKPTPKHVEDSLVYQRIEPRYEILQTIGKRVQSEAILAVPEDKAVTLRSRRSLKEGRKVDGSPVDDAWPGSLDIKGNSWKVDCVASKMKAAGEIATKTNSLKEGSISHSQHVSQEQVTELDENRTGQQHATMKALYIANKHKEFVEKDDKISKLPSGTDKRKSEVVFPGKMEGSKMFQCFPESFGRGPDRTDGCEARANIGQNVTSPVTSEPENQPPLYGTAHYQWQKLSRRSVDSVRIYEQEESKVCGLRACPPAYGAQEQLSVLDRRPEGHRFQKPDADERVRRGGHHVSAPKTPERWRRKTLPHGALRFEEAGGLAEERAKAQGRRDSLQLHDKSIAKRSPKLSYGAGPWDGTFISPCSPDKDLKNQLSPSEPKATYFAVTYQATDENKNIPGKAFDPLKTNHVSSLAEDASATSSTSISRRDYPSNAQYNKIFSDAKDSQHRYPNKKWAEGGEGDMSDLSKKGAFKYPLTEARGENWVALEKQRVDVKARVTEVDPHHLSEPKSPSSFRHLHQDSEHLGQKNCSGCSHGLAKGAASLKYRSRVLDIDALMAEYEEDSKKASMVQDKRESRLPEESSLPLCGNNINYLAHNSNSQDKMSSGYNWRDPKGLDHSPESTRQGFYGTESLVSNKVETCSQDLNPLKARDIKFSPPPWEKPAVEKPKFSPTDPISTRKKTFLVDEEQGESLVFRHQRAKVANYDADSSTLVHMNVEPEASFAHRPSQVLTGGALVKGVSLKQQAAGDDRHTTVDTSGVKKTQACANGSFLEIDSSAAKSRTEWNSASSGLANALPDLRRSFSEKGRRPKARSSLPFGPEARERQGQDRVYQSFPSESADSRPNKQSTPQHNSVLHKRTKGLEKEWTKPDRDDSGARNSAYRNIQRRSHSFYKEKAAHPWAADQLKQCFGKSAAEAKDTDTLVQEADSQYGTWSDQRHSGDSFVPESPSSESTVAPARRQPPSSRFSSFSSQTDPTSAADQHDSSRDQRSTSLDRSSTDAESAEGTEVPASASAAGASPDFSFLQTPVLDSSLLKTRVQLSKRRRQQRAPISHALRRSTVGGTEGQLSVTEEVDSAWMFKDSTEKSAKKEESDEEGKLHPAGRSPVSQPQRIPVLPGMDPSAFKAQLRKRHESEGTGEGSPARLSKSPKSPFQTGSPAGRMLPVGAEKEERSEEASPQWLKELRSKKRQSQYENQV